jgi:hypothetical protein
MPEKHDVLVPFRALAGQFYNWLTPIGQFYNWLTPIGQGSKYFSFCFFFVILVCNILIFKNINYERKRLSFAYIWGDIQY